jgi:hypothetical protein
LTSVYVLVWVFHNLKRQDDTIVSNVLLARAIASIAKIRELAAALE